jgi:Co/Zn/Cd efflux system component
MGVMIHVIGDAINNLGVMAAGLVIWLAAPHAGRYYADPGVSMFIAILIILSSFPLSKNVSSRSEVNRKLTLSSASSGNDPTRERTDGG